MDTPELTTDLQKILEARHHDPFAVLGKHALSESQTLIRVFMPHIHSVNLLPAGSALQRIENSDLFIWEGDGSQIEEHYQLETIDSVGNRRVMYDPYSFSPQLSDFDLHLFGEGKHWHAYRFLGAHPHLVDGIAGVLFAVWAPNAERVSVVGDFNCWDGRCHPMRVVGSSGVWELFIPELPIGSLYKFELRNRETGEILTKIDPYAKAFERRPQTAAYVTPSSSYPWRDNAWLIARRQQDWLHQPFSIYEVHLGSWQRDEEGNFLNYRELARRLVEYVLKLGFTHIELLPISEHPLDESWGYQTTGYYAPTSRFGTPDDFRYFVDYCHQNNLGVILDWVPSHFPKDAHALARFDGTALYEYADPRQGEHKEWGTLVFNYARHEVKNFLIANAVYWLDEFHIDGLRVDAVASMLYLDYSREAHEWLPNRYGGNENLEAIAFLQELNSVTHSEYAGTLMIAEESTSWAQVTRPTWRGGLGFSMKWNMGWMHDTLNYMQKDPVYRSYHHDLLTFGLLYAFTENFVAPFSHDEVVHGKRSLLDKMPGDSWQRFANLRLLYTYLWTYPAKKLLFMGCEFAQGREWSEARGLDWELTELPAHSGMQSLVRDLNQLYCQKTALHHADFEGQGFAWIDCHDAHQSVLAYVRRSAESFVLVVLNFTPTPRYNYRIGVPCAGLYQEIFNSDSMYYAGSNVGNSAVHSETMAWMGQAHSVSLTLPPLAGIVLECRAE
jgi:1,4-alpha-glucan branching enzyme